MSKATTIREILERVQLYAKDSPMEQTASDKNDIEFATKQLLDLLDKVIGEDEPVITKIGKGSISNGIVVFRNDLRAKQRQALRELGEVKE